jgi:FHA domain
MDQRPAAGEQGCPRCGERCHASDRYCERCGRPLGLSEAPAPAGRWALVLGVDEQRAAWADCPPPAEPRPDQVFLLDRSPMVLGRGEADRLDIPIRGDPAVSRRHAELVRADGGWAIRDLGTANGTRVNGLEVNGASPTPIGLGDVIEIGCFSRLEVRCVEEERG